MTATQTSSALDHAARDLSRRVVEGRLDADDAARTIIAEAICGGEVGLAVRRHHLWAVPAEEHEEFIAAATHLFALYALPGDGRPSPLDVTPFWEGGASASGWVSKTVQALVVSRVRREYGTTETPRWELPERGAWDIYDLGELDGVPSPDDLEDASRDLLREGETLLRIHASILHRLLGGPALAVWDLTRAQRRMLRDALGRDPQLARRALSTSGEQASTVESRIAALWSPWSQEAIAEALEKSTTERDIPGLVTRAALSDIPRPPTRGRVPSLSARRRRMIAALPSVPANLSGTLFDAFESSRVSLYADKDRRRRPLSTTAQTRRSALAASFPSALSTVASASDICRDDLVSGLTALFLDQIPCLDVEAFTPTPWRFR